jgi:peptidoglycan/xylan/chitin deacetylase (PgdA/CDA1 family)
LWQDWNFLTIATLTWLFLNYEKVDPKDPSYTFVETKISEAQHQNEVEQQFQQSFTQAKQNSAVALKEGRYQDSIDAANLALSLISDEHHIDQKDVATLTKTRDAAKMKLAVAQTRFQDQTVVDQNVYQLRVPVLMYHYIRINPDSQDQVGFNLSVTPDDFDQQMAYLAAHGYHAIDVQQLTEALKSHTSLPPNPIVLTFDDGYRDFYTDAYPILQKYGLHAESYVAPGLLGGDNYMSWEMLKEVAASGLVTIGSHTVRHLYLPGLPESTRLQELRESKRLLEEPLGIIVNDFCYPYGGYNEQVAHEVEEAGYTNATTTVGGTLHPEGQYFTITRVRVGGGESLSTFVSHL